MSDRDYDVVSGRMTEYQGGEVTGTHYGPAVDLVNAPPHYKAGGMEAIDVIEAFAPTNFHRGNAIKYVLRAGRKGDLVEDLRKARWYIDREIAANDR